MALRVLTLAQGTVATTGTEVRMASAPYNGTGKIVRIYVTAPAANTGNIYIGDLNVATTRGIELVKGGSPLILESQGGDMLDPHDFFVDAATSGDKFQVTCLIKMN